MLYAAKAAVEPPAPASNAGTDDATEAEMDLDTPEAVQAAIAELFPKKDTAAVEGSVEEFDKIAALFVAWLEKNKPRKTSLLKHFLAASLDRGDLTTAANRRSWYNHWRKKYKGR